VGQPTVFFNAQPYWPREMAAVRHWYELSASDQVVVRIDIAQEGVQGGNWDVPVRPARYQLPAANGPYRGQFWIMPLRAGDVPMSRAREKAVW